MANEYKLDNGAIVRVAPLTVVNRERYRTLLRLSNKHLKDISQKLGLADTVDDDGMANILLDMVMVSAFVQTDHPISAYLLEYTSDLGVFVAGIGEFLDALTEGETSSVFEQLVGFVNSYLRDQRVKAPEPPTDPN